ncbi:hypothetical protein Vadar_009227 [Vaccinium darrowii]|uniref:Uncharacterized protein n=1 Tax=Vaccinium darrowii TaxID=229202 RepID=A0ACB7ZIG8_9ERIC|nr:hypothetical protein Vadar_009227 [Vaccinium darrowii]
MTMKVENVNIMLLKKRENVNGKPFVLTPKIKSVLDPCEYKNDDIQDDAVSLGADYETKVGHSKGEHFTAVPTGKQQTSEKVGMSDQVSNGTNNSQHPEEDEQEVGKVKDWINCYQLRMVELTDVLTNFPDVSPVLIEGKWRTLNMLKLVKEDIQLRSRILIIVWILFDWFSETIVKLLQEGTLSKAGLDRYTIMRQKNPEFDSVMEEMDGHVVANGKNARQDTGDYHMHKKTRNLLWMQDAKGRTIKCTKKVTPIGTPYSQTSLRSLSQDLAKVWPNLFGPNVGFWKREYGKHGICHFTSSNEYLEEGMAIYAEVKRALMIQDPFSFFPEFSSSTGVVAGQRYTPVDLANTILQLSQSQLGWTASGRLFPPARIPAKIQLCYLSFLLNLQLLPLLHHCTPSISYCFISPSCNSSLLASSFSSTSSFSSSSVSYPSSFSFPYFSSLSTDIFVLPITVVHGVVGFFRSLGSFLPYYGGGGGEE